MSSTLKAPFPYFGGKSRVASVVWRALGDVRNYIEPFAGSLAVLLGRPDTHTGSIETVNDLDGMVANFWRATAHDPDAVAHHADWPVNENDLHARHAWLVGQRDSITAQLDGDPDWYDAKAAGWWVWGICLWIGSGWCSGKGPWQVVDGQLVHLGNAGRGVNRKRVHLGNAGQGINRQRDGNTCAEWSEHLRAMFGELRDRLRRVRVCCGSWERVCSSCATLFPCGGFPADGAPFVTGVFLDPPYTADADRCGDLYAKDCMSIGHDVAAWCREWGDRTQLRIVLCGYECEYEMPGWTQIRWNPKGGYGAVGEDGRKLHQDNERLWLSPHCLPLEEKREHVQRSLFEEVPA